VCLLHLLCVLRCTDICISLFIELDSILTVPSTETPSPLRSLLSTMEEFEPKEHIQPEDTQREYQMEIARSRLAMAALQSNMEVVILEKLCLEALANALRSELQDSHQEVVDLKTQLEDTNEKLGDLQSKVDDARDMLRY